MTTSFLFVDSGIPVCLAYYYFALKRSEQTLRIKLSCYTATMMPHMHPHQSHH